MTDSPVTVWQRLDSAGRFIENVFLVGILAGMILLSVAQIIARELFNSGFYWSGEVIQLMVLWLAMAGAVAACRENRHIRIDAISHWFSEKSVLIVRLFVDAFAAVICAILAWHSWRWVQLEREYEDVLLTDTPAWLIHIIVPIGFALMSYRFLIGIGLQAFAIGDVDQETDK